MEPFKAKELPFTYNIDKELLKLIAEANEKYGEYKSYLKNLEFDSKFFLNSILLSESLKSTQIEGTQISQDEIYYLKYMPKTDDNSEIQNFKKVIEYSENYLKTKKEIVEESGVSRNIVSHRIDQSVEIGILEVDSTYAKKAYKYKDIYNVFVGKEII